MPGRKFIIKSIEESLGINDERYKFLLETVEKIRSESTNKVIILQKIAKIATPNYTELLVMAHFAGTRAGFNWKIDEFEIRK